MAQLMSKPPKQLASLSMPDDRGLTSAMAEVQAEAKEAELAMAGIKKSGHDVDAALRLARHAMSGVETERKLVDFMRSSQDSAPVAVLTDGVQRKFLAERYKQREGPPIAPWLAGGAALLLSGLVLGTFVTVERRQRRGSHMLLEVEASD